MFQFQQHFTDSFFPVAEIVLWKLSSAQDKISSSSYLAKNFQKFPSSYLCVFYISFLHVAWRKCSEIGLNWGMKCLREHFQQRCRSRGVHTTPSRGPSENCLGWFAFFVFPVTQLLQGPIRPDNPLTTVSGQSISFPFIALSAVQFTVANVLQ